MSDSKSSSNANLGIPLGPLRLFMVCMTFVWVGSCVVTCSPTTATERSIDWIAHLVRYARSLPWI